MPEHFGIRITDADDNHGAQVRVSQAESLVRSARLFLLDTLDRQRSPLIATGEVTMVA